ncbi:hypothetical protein cypCar_00023355, partial [Cyprinus carpio]
FYIIHQHFYLFPRKWWLKCADSKETLSDDCPLEEVL